VSDALALRFESERFDYRSELPSDANAGNRFYGRDVAEWLAAALDGAGLACEVVDEDWGWLVDSRRARSLRFEIAVYNLAEHGEGGRPGIGAWGLVVRCHEPRSLFGLPLGVRAVMVPAELRTVIDGAIREAGAEPRPWDDAR
jgi:hypothetical protein